MIKSTHWNAESWVLTPEILVHLSRVGPSLCRLTWHPAPHHGSFAASVGATLWETLGQFWNPSMCECHGRGSLSRHGLRLRRGEEDWAFSHRIVPTHPMKRVRWKYCRTHRWILDISSNTLFLFRNIKRSEFIMEEIEMGGGTWLRSPRKAALTDLTYAVTKILMPSDYPMFYVLFSLFVSSPKVVSWDVDCPLLAKNKKTKKLCIF